MRNSMVLLSIFLFTSLMIFAGNPEELGKVEWLRNYDLAISKAKAADKPVLILFQEVPGCATCRNYGHNVLSHPLMVEAIENEFIPLAIYNNKAGKDAEILKKYNEPSWNNPVVRVVDEKGEDIINRIASDYSAKGLSSGLISALNKSGKSIPTYLELLDEELSADIQSNKKEAYYKMYCFWSGEKQLGSVTGVLNTESGFIGTSESVKVTYNPQKVDDQTLEAFANKNAMEKVGETAGFKLATGDLHYYLQHSNYKYLPLSDLQKTKINSALGRKLNAEIYLSPMQKKWLYSIQASSGKAQVLFDKEIDKAWTTIETSGL